MSQWNPELARSYDRIAAAYAGRFGDELDRKPFDRELLDAFALENRGEGVIADVGCGPGHVGRYLIDRGCTVVGVDISPKMATTGRSLVPDMRFVVGSFYDLPIATGGLRGAIAFYSLIHAERKGVVDALRELNRVLRVGGTLLTAVHAGAGEAHADDFLGEPFTVDATYFERDELAGYLDRAGFEVTGGVTREPYESETTRRVYMTARAKRA